MVKPTINKKSTSKNKDKNIISEDDEDSAVEIQTTLVTKTPKNNSVNTDEIKQSSSIVPFVINLYDVSKFEEQVVSKVSNVDLLKVLIQRGTDQCNPALSVGAEILYKKLNRVPMRPIVGSQENQFAHGRGNGRGRGRGGHHNSNNNRNSYQRYSNANNNNNNDDEEEPQQEADYNNQPRHKYNRNNNGNNNNNSSYVPRANQRNNSRQNFIDD